MPTPPVLVRSLVKAAVRAIETGLPVDSLPHVVPLLIQETWDAWSKEQTEEERRAEVVQLAGTSSGEIESMLRDLVRTQGGGAPAADRDALVAKLVGLLSAVARSGPSSSPASSLRMLSRDDLRALLNPSGGGP